MERGKSFYRLPNTHMKNTITSKPEVVSETRSHTSRFVKSLIAGLLMTAFTIWAQPTKAQDTASAVSTDSTKTEKVEAPKKSGVFMIDPMYSITGKTFITRIQWWGTVGGLQVGGILDLSGTDIDQGITTAFGKITVSKSLWKNGTLLSMEYMLHTASKDKVRVGIQQVFKSEDGSVFFKVYPLSDKWFEPFILIWADHKLWDYLGISWFVGTDIASQSYYGEWTLTVGKGDIQGLGQMRVSGEYDKDPDVSGLLGIRIKF